jgi:hypothetical protein
MEVDELQTAFGDGFYEVAFRCSLFAFRCSSAFEKENQYICK